MTKERECDCHEHDEHEHDGSCCHEHDGCCCHEHDDCCCDDHDGCCCHEHGTGCGDPACDCHHHDHGMPNKPHIATPSFQAQDPNKGVSLGADAESEIAAVMKKRYARFLEGDEHFDVKTEVCHHFGLVSSMLTNGARTTNICIEASVECEENKIENPMDAYTKALDVLDLVWLDYFDSDRISHYMPIWQSYEIDGMQVNVRLEHNNPALDDAASAFLREHGFLEGGLSPADYDDEE